MAYQQHPLPGQPGVPGAHPHHDSTGAIPGGYGHVPGAGPFPGHVPPAGFGIPGHIPTAGFHAGHVPGMGPGMHGHIPMHPGPEGHIQEHGGSGPPLPWEEEEPSLEQQQKEGDLSGEWGKRTFCKRHYYSMLPLRILLHFCGRFPISSTLEEDGTYTYKCGSFHPSCLYFLFVSFMTFYLLVMGLINVAIITVNVSITYEDPTIAKIYEERRRHEQILMWRYFIPVIYIYTSLFQIFVSSVLIFRKRHYLAHYLSFWSRAVYTLHMDVSRQGMFFNFKCVFVLLVLVSSLVLFALFGIGVLSSGAPTVFGLLSWRWFFPKIRWLEESTLVRQLVQATGAISFLYTFLASKTPIAFFIYTCKTLQTAFAYWNGRVYAAVLRGGKYIQTEEGRTKFKLLFKDHCILLDLMEGLDQCYAFQLETFFVCQVFSFFFELYFCIRTARYGNNRGSAAYPAKSSSAFFVRPGDWAPSMLLTFVSVAMMATAAKSASEVAEEAIAGMEVLRRKTMLKRKTDEELYFMLSMFSSYTAYKKLEISAGGYSYVNKEFLIGIFSAALSYFIILYQFQPVMDLSLSAQNESAERAKYGKFLENLEGLEVGHYETTPANADVWSVLRNGTNLIAKKPRVS